MTLYRVLGASVYRGSGILSVQIEGTEDGVVPHLEVEGRPEKKLRYKGGRIVYENNNVTKKKDFNNRGAGLPHR